MPSGSHGGGGGSHGGGGFGGSGFRGSHTPRQSYVHRHNVFHPPHRYYFFGRVYSVGSYRYYTMSKISTWIFFAFVAVLVCGVFFFQQQSAINQVKSDQAYYFNMIENADSDQYMTAVVRNQYEGDGGKYYITYNLVVNNNYLWAEDGYTYSIYTMEEASAIFQAGEIDIVVDRLPLTINTDSINADYMDYSLSDDGYYSHAVLMRTIIIIAGSVAVIAVLGFASYYFKMMFSYQLTGEEKTNLFSEKKDENPNEKTEYCLYCGSVMSKDDDKCPKCGSARSYTSDDYVDV